MHSLPRFFYLSSVFALLYCFPHNLALGFFEKLLLCNLKVGDLCNTGMANCLEKSPIVETGKVNSPTRSMIAFVGLSVSLWHRKRISYDSSKL